MHSKINRFIGILIVVLLPEIHSTGQELNHSIERGKKLYATNCQNCHMANGKGVKGVFPPLASSDYLMSDLDRSIEQILYGANKPMTVNGVEYNGNMMGFEALSNQEVADILNYIRNSWGNSGKRVSSDQVEKIRK